MSCPLCLAYYAGLEPRRSNGDHRATLPDDQNHRVALQGGTPTTLATGQSIGAPTVDSTSVYWTNTSAVMKLTPK